jgi:hypothetical protein
MSTVTIDAALFEKLTQTLLEVPLAGPDGRIAGYYVPPGTYQAMRKAFYDRLFAQVTIEDLNRSLADPRRHSMEEVLRLVEGD